MPIRQSQYCRKTHEDDEFLPLNPRFLYPLRGTKGAANLTVRVNWSNALGWNDDRSGADASVISALQTSETR